MRRGNVKCLLFVLYYSFVLRDKWFLAKIVTGDNFLTQSKKLKQIKKKDCNLQCYY